MRKLSSLLVLAGLLVVLVAAGTVRAAAQPPCNGTKIEPVESGTYAVPFGTTVGSITITTHGDDAGATFDFVTDSSSHIVTSVGVKGGNTDPVYYTVNSSWSTGFHAADNEHSGTWYGLSYLCLETAENGGPEPE